MVDRVLSFWTRVVGREGLDEAIHCFQRVSLAPAEMFICLVQQDIALYESFI